MQEILKTEEELISAAAAPEELQTAAEESTPPPPKKKRRRRRLFSKRKLHTNIFIICMLAYPVFQFVVMWAFVNVDSILMTFQKYDTLEGWRFVGLDNYANWFEKFKVDSAYKIMFVNSALHSVVGMFIIFPLCLVISYFLCRKIPCSGFFRVVFYLPSIIPLVVLVLGFTNMIKVDGLLGKLYEGFNKDAPALLVPPKVRWTVYAFTIWAGIGGNLLLLSGTIKRVPTEVLESARLDGVGTFGELFRIVVPMIWPTLVTLFIMSMMGIFSVVFQPLFLTDKLMDDTMTIGLWIFNKASDNSGNVQAATLGIMSTIVVAPIILLTRWGLDKMFKNINY
ncbi:MAG: sugar ABC transporter permease [Clostridia bacterium]|nr:sugar ABC transporter permease [Clostridia bacterium]